MSIYTKRGDSGKMSLMNGVRISKSDDRAELLGTIDELNSSLGLVKVISESPLRENLEAIQHKLMQLMSGIADPRSQKYHVTKDDVAGLEKQIDELENSFPRAKEFVLYGGCELSARLDMARAIARRTERRFHKVAQTYGADAKAGQYLNRLSDYLYMQARYSDHRFKLNKEEKIRQTLIRDVMK